MTLNKEDLNRLSYLLGKQQHFPLNQGEIFELRTLISKEQPCPIGFVNMINLGVIIVGAYTIKEIYDDFFKGTNDIRG